MATRKQQNENKQGGREFKPGLLWLEATSWPFSGTVDMQALWPQPAWRVSQKSRWTVTAWERLLAANIMVSSKAWYKNAYDLRDELMMKTDKPEGCSYEIHSWRGDGTNGSILHSRKVHTCEITSLFHEPSLGSDINLVFPDLQFIPTSCGAKEAHSIYLKQLECAGLESWGRKKRRP